MEPPTTGRYVQYPAHERPDVEVQLDDDTWAEGELRAWKHVDRAWVGLVTWRRGPGQGTRTGDFPADRIREDTRNLTPPGWTP